LDLNVNGRRRRRTQFIFAGLLLVALLVRIYYLRSHVVVLEGEGAGYAHQAQNLLSGRGFESYLYPRPDLEHCWMQPLLIAAVFPITRDLDRATHLVSLASGTLLIVWLFLIANRLYGIWAAWIAAALGAFHPLLVSLSTTGYAEILAMGLQFGAIYWSIRFMEDDGPWSGVIAGSWWGLSYLNRTECLVLPLATVGLYCLRTCWMRKRLLTWARQSALMLLVFTLFVAPYAFLFYHYTGKVRFEGKNLLNYTIGERELDGKSPAVASRELTSSLQELGPALNTGAYTSYSPYPTHFRDLLRYFRRMARRNLDWVRRSMIRNPFFGGFALTLLALLGLLVQPWNPVRVFRELYLAGLATYTTILLLASHLQIPRYVFPILPILLIWGSAGAAFLATRILRFADRAKFKPDMGRLMATAAAIALVLLVLRPPFKSIDGLPDITSGWAPNDIEKEAGQWLHSAAPGLKSSYGSDDFCYYASSYEWILPYTDSATALRYFHKKNPDYIFLDSSNLGYTPYYDEWLNKGIPDSAATLIYQKELIGQRKVVIYKWAHL
jgi:hypothetical protein